MRSPKIAAVRRFSNRHANALVLTGALLLLLLQLLIWLPRPEPATELPRLEAAAEDGMSGARVNINHAGAALLSELPGIGEKLAMAIVLYREEHGSFSSIEELTQVPGVGKGKLDGIREWIAK